MFKGLINIKNFKIIGFLLMIGLMIVLNARQEENRNKTGVRHTSKIVSEVDHSGLIPNNATIPAKTEGTLPLKLISKTNSNFLLVINNCQFFIQTVKYNLLQKNFLNICARIHYNFITEFLATLRNKDYK